MRPSRGQDIRSFYRRCLRQAGKLPRRYLQLFFRLKFGDDIRSLARSADCPGLFQSKAKRVKRNLRTVERSNSGHSRSFATMLDLAYGRKGKLRWELMEPFAHGASVAGLHASPKLPTYSPALAALLTSCESRITKPLRHTYLIDPPNLPARANPESDEARLLGPLSKSRENNIRWRYFTAECKKVLPPLEVVTSKDASSTSTVIHGYGFEGQNMHRDIEAFAGPLWKPRPKTRKEALVVCSEQKHDVQGSARHPSRWVRRRYQQLLSRIPILTRSSSISKSQPHTRYQAALSSNASSDYLRFSPARLAEVDAADVLWLKKSEMGGKISQ